jgi:adenylate cyclase
MRIVFTSPSGISEQFATESSTVLIGRQLAPRPDHLDLKDGEVSSQHARLTSEGQECWIEDLGSTNGTWVDRKKIKTKTRLTPESIIRVGRTTLKIKMEAAPPPSPQPPGHREEQPPVETPVESVDAGEPLPEQFLAGGSLESARLRLSAVYELNESLGEIDSLDSLASALLDHLSRVFPLITHSGHSGLLIGENLALKAYRPEDQPPTYSLTLARHVLTQKKGYLWQGETPSGVEKSASLLHLGIQSAMYVPLIWRGETLGILYLDASSPQAVFDREDLRLMQIMATQAAMFMKNLSLQQTLQRESLVKSRLLAQFPRPIAERMARQPTRLSIVSERVDTVTVLFSDVRGFTKLTTVMEPELVVQMLNDMFHDLTPIILKHNGTVDKYVGDAILAVFGSPDPDELQSEHAVQAALEMQAAIQQLASVRWRGRTAFQIGIGIHTGPAIHGFIGAPERMEYTVIGSTINGASRYCNAAGPAEILISPETYARLHRCVEVDHPPREIETKHEGRLRAYLVRGWKEK